MVVEATFTVQQYSPVRTVEIVPGDVRVEVNSLVKRMLGNEYNARDGRRVMSWIESRLELLPDGTRESFVEAVLKERDAREVAREMGLAWATIRGRLSDAFQLLGVLARSLPKDRFERLFKSVYEYEFGDEVRTKELTLCLFGRYDRRSTQAVAVRWIPKVQNGEVDLPMPRKEGKFWVWTKEQAEAWRDWFAKGKPEPEKEEVDAR